MTARPMTERALSDEEWAAMTDEQWLQHRIARCAAEGWTANKERYERLLSTSSAVRGMREALGELLAADDAMAAFIIAVEPAVLGETEWAQQHHERSARRRKAIAKARAALSLEGEDKQARATPSAPTTTDTKDTTK